MKIHNERGAGRKPIPIEFKRQALSIRLPPDLIAAIPGNKSRFIEKLIIDAIKPERLRYAPSCNPQKNA